VPPPDLFGVKKDDDSVSCACCCVDWAHFAHFTGITTDITDSNGVFTRVLYWFTWAVCGRYGFTSVFVSEFFDIKALLNVLGWGACAI
jgi:hypothetical protein